MQGKLLELSLASIAEIDCGRIREAFAIALRRCQADCKDRPGLVDPRSPGSPS